MRIRNPNHKKKQLIQHPNNASCTALPQHYSREPPPRSLINLSHFSDLSPLLSLPVSARLASIFSPAAAAPRESSSSRVNYPAKARARRLALHTRSKATRSSRTHTYIYIKGGSLSLPAFSRPVAQHFVPSLSFASSVAAAPCLSLCLISHSRR